MRGKLSSRLKTPVKRHLCGEGYSLAPHPFKVGGPNPNQSGQKVKMVPGPAGKKALACRA
jgi:hypothetical protein